MGTIWKGRHTGQGVAVAVKVMTGDEATSREFRKSFRTEVWAMARLEHRGIVRVFDQGVVPAAMEAHGLPAGAPYIVMDLVGDGTTLSQAPPNDWWSLKRTLLLLLDALAHAHARGVVHRDLKPANILVDPDVDGSGGLQLTDFGISHAMERVLPSEEGAAPVMGTLQYMAPEQMDGSWRDFGPWTDLYSLGCIAWELACGELPFKADDPLDLMDMHLEEEPPDFVTRIPVPSGFEALVRDLLAKEPYDRPSRAADVARQLKELRWEGDEERTLALGLTMTEGLPAVQPERIEEFLTESLTKTHPVVGPVDLGLQTLTEVRPVAPPTLDEDDDDGIEDSAIQAGRRLALSWRRQRRPREWKRLAGVGLGLWGLRPLPLVGRDAQLDAIWTALAQTHAEHRARAVLIDGPLGLGASRTALWMCERAHELGVAEILWATHSPQNAASDGLGRMLAREFRTTGLSPAMCADRVEDVLLRRGLTREEKAEGFARELVRWTKLRRGSPVPSLARSDDESLRPRFKELYRFVRRVARRRPVVLWIDDAQWGLEAMAFAWYVLRAQETKPADVLLVLSLQRSGLDDDDEARRVVDLIEEQPTTLRLEMTPLQEASLEHLLADLLGLDRGIARKVAETSAGNPLFATQLMGDWVRRGVLEPGPWGYRLAAGEEAEIPADLSALWDQRLDSALRRLGDGGAESLTIAAAMGGRVTRTRFLEVSDELGWPPPAKLAETLYSERLATPSKGGWSFVHDGLTVALERRARLDGRWKLARRAVRAQWTGLTALQTTAKTRVPVTSAGSG